MTPCDQHRADYPTFQHFNNVSINVTASNHHTLKISWIQLRHVRSPSHCTCFSESSSQKVCARKTPMKTSLGTKVGSHGKSSKFKSFSIPRKCLNKIHFQIRTLPQCHLFSRSTTQYELIWTYMQSYWYIMITWYMIICCVSLCTIYTCTRLKEFTHMFNHVPLYQWYFIVFQWLSLGPLRPSLEYPLPYARTARLL